MAYAKNTSEYWKGRIFKEERKGVQSANYYMRIRKDGRLYRFNLESGNQQRASKKAAEVFVFFKANGIDDALRKYKEKKPEPNADLTVGDLIRAYEKSRILKPTTLTDYRRKFYSLVGGVKGFRSDDSKHDHHNGLDKIYRKRIESVRISDLTPEKIRKWKIDFIAVRGSDVQSQEHAKKTASSILRNSKSLFKTSHLLELGLSIPHDPFENVEIGSSTVRRYFSKIDARELVKLAQDELWVQMPEKNQNEIRAARSKREQYKIFLLALVAGLRREEIDVLLWEQVDLKNGRIHVRANKYYSLKTENSERMIDLPDSVAELLRSWKKDTEGEFVIWSLTDPKPNAHYRHYRCHRHIQRLNSWLREHGADSKNPLHSLRKEYGSLICEQAGIYAACMSLGHGDIRTTQGSYLDLKKKVVVDPF